MEDLVSKRKKRLQGILGAAHYALGGMADDAQEHMNEMDSGEGDFLSSEQDDTAPHMGMPEDPEHEVDGMGKAKARLSKLLMPKFKKK